MNLSTPLNMPVLSIFLIGFPIIIGFSLNHPSLLESTEQKTDDLIRIWATSSHNWFMNQNCGDFDNLDEYTCTLMKRVKPSHIRVYGASLIDGVQYDVIFPEGKVKNMSHDGVLILDPFPTAEFGHPILVFLVDVVDPFKCKTGFFVDDRFCIQPWSNHYCIPRKVNYIPDRMLECAETIFLPLVYSMNFPLSRENNRLRCFSNVNGFDPICPKLRPVAESAKVLCHPWIMNRDCGFLENSIVGRCVNTRTCDQAVLLSGGWNRQMSDVQSLDNIKNVRQMLLAQGFLEENIAVFYANGIQRSIDNQEDSDPSENEVIYYSSSLKSTLRNHFRTLCKTEYCSDTLFVYMNSPTRQDGASLMWDLMDFGIYNENEIYPPKEFLRDISNCNAKRVVVIADQSYGESLITAAEGRFNTLENVIIFTSTDRFNNEGPKDRLTWHLLKRGMNHHICLQSFKDEIVSHFNTPMFIGVQSEILNSTLIGGPCSDQRLPLDSPLTLQYKGCTTTIPETE